MPETTVSGGKGIDVRVANINGADAKVAIVVPVANAHDSVAERFLAHLEKCTELHAQVIMVESSGPGFSFGRSVNTGISLADKRLELIIGLDSDAYPRKGALEEMVRYAEANPRIGYIGATIVTPSSRHPNIGWTDQTVIWFIYQSIMNRAPLFALRRLLKGHWSNLSTRSPADYIPGKMVGFISTAYLLRRQCYDDVGPFDERYRISFVDVDYSFRVLISDKWYISVCRSAVIDHEEHTTRTVWEKHPDFDLWDTFLADWPRERMALVRQAAARGKFVIPEKA